MMLDHVNLRRLLKHFGHVPPPDYEARSYEQAAAA
jgi:hypothetical protein